MAPLLSGLTALPFGGLDFQLRNLGLPAALRANEIESSEPLRERGYPDSGPTIVLIISMGAEQSGATLFPHFLQDDQARLQGLEATSLSLIFHPLPGARGSLPSTPLHLPLVPSRSHPQLNPKEQLRSPRATVWVQFPST